MYGLLKGKGIHPIKQTDSEAWIHQLETANVQGFHSDGQTRDTLQK